jgi:molybdopterin synthase sulfur carrier subunit
VPAGTLPGVAIIRLFASAREAAGTGRDDLPGATVADVLGAARARYGSGFVDVLPTCRIWVNGEAAGESTPVGPSDEVAVLPPVSGGAA